MRVIFAGTPDFAAAALSALIEARHDIVLVLTQPDRPAGRGMALTPSPVKQCAQAANIPVFQPLTLKDPAAQAVVAERQAEVMVVAAYGLILPQSVLDMPKWGCVNLHASLLPRWRGAAPIQRALLAGDSETGVCLMQMAAGLDTGPVLWREALPIAEHETSATLHDKLMALGARMIVDALPRLPLPAVDQPELGVTYAHKLDKAEARIDWQHSAADIDRQIRAFNPFPGAYTQWGGQVLKLWQAEVLPGCAPHEAAEIGQILAVDRETLIVACGQGQLALRVLQKAGGKRLPVRDFLAGTPVSVGDVLGR